jgi:hypothetical protein
MGQRRFLGSGKNSKESTRDNDGAGWRIECVRGRDFSVCSTFAGVVLSEGAEQAKAYRRIFRLGKESWS